ncbi:hypothetical protein Pcinc_024573 [Petrolisthes cinctipes]|uniref:Uncharacterized protein n=1 Tax=Petrolisthes cinctipes TaxID=88211 RepID=A0AAE1KAM0_PETCI|nr:hypothetical protein Pcinc_024573 [Petrolisthes cinctipes]
MTNRAYISRDRKLTRNKDTATHLQLLHVIQLLYTTLQPQRAPTSTPRRHLILPRLLNRRKCGVNVKPAAAPPPTPPTATTSLPESTHEPPVAVATMQDSTTTSCLFLHYCHQPPAQTVSLL